MTLTAVSGASVAHSWADGVHGASLLDTLAHRLANLTTVLLFPVWEAIWIFRLMPMRHPAAGYVGSGVGWAMWLFVGVIAVRLIRWPRAGRAAGVAGNPANPERRAFLARSAFAAALPCTAGIGTLSNPWSLVVRRYRVSLRGLPRELDGLRLVQITDTHLGAWVPRSHVDRAVRMALDLKPDLYVLTGDYIHMYPDFVVPGVEAMRPLVEDRRAMGVCAVRGNHDHYGNGPRTLAALREVGTRVIENDRLFIDAATRTFVPTPPEQGLCIAGVADLWEDTIDPRAALRGVPDEMPRVLLAHNPDSAEVIARYSPTLRVDLMLSGHMHGGQVWLPFIGSPWVPSRYGSKYAHGLVQGPLGPVIVSAGVGMSGIPMRIFVPPEVVEVTLVSEG